VFGKLADVLGHAPPLGGDVRLRLAAASARDPALAPSVMGFLTLAAVELVRLPAASIPHSLAALIELVASPLTAEQLHGRELLGRLLEVLGPLKSDHVLEMCAALWDGGVVREASLQLDPATADKLERNLKEVRDDPRRSGSAVAQRLLTGLRLVGLRFLCIPQTAAYLTAPLDTFLQVFAA
jgi:hypothetical protein